MDNFLRFESLTNQQYMKRCPYRRRCTYGNKCKYWHPERDVSADVAGNGNGTFKTAHQTMLDRVAEEKFKQQMAKLNADEYYDAVAFHPHFGIRNQQQQRPPQQQQQSAGFASRMMHQQELDIRTMGPESLKSHSSPDYPQLKQQPQPQKIANLNKNMAGMSFQNEWGSTIFNPVIGGSTYTPFSSTTLLGQQSTQFGSSEIDACAKFTQNAKTQQQQQPIVGLTAKPKSDSPFLDSTDEIPKPTRNLSPSSIRAKLAEILDEDQVTTFLNKYADVREEAELMFLAQSMKFDSFGL